VASRTRAQCIGPETPGSMSASREALDPALRKGFVQSSQDGSQHQIFSY
jgi:hypothetical protein